MTVVDVTRVKIEELEDLKNDEKVEKNEYYLLNANLSKDVSFTPCYMSIRDNNITMIVNHDGITSIDKSPEVLNDLFCCTGLGLKENYIVTKDFTRDMIISLLHRHNILIDVMKVNVYKKNEYIYFVIEEGLNFDIYKEFFDYFPYITKNNYKYFIQNGKIEDSIKEYIRYRLVSHNYSPAFATIILDRVFKKCSTNLKTKLKMLNDFLKFAESLKEEGCTPDMSAYLVLNYIEKEDK